MPIYEFKCLKCNEMIEVLIMKQDEKVELRCPKCKSEDLERIMSSTSYAMGDSGKSKGASSQTRTCSTGSCTTYEIPGHTK